MIWRLSISSLNSLCIETLSGVLLTIRRRANGRRLLGVVSKLLWVNESRNLWEVCGPVNRPQTQLVGSPDESTGFEKKFDDPFVTETGRQHERRLPCRTDTIYVGAQSHKRFDKIAIAKGGCSK